VVVVVFVFVVVVAFVVIVTVGVVIGGGGGGGVLVSGVRLGICIASRRLSGVGARELTIFIFPSRYSTKQGPSIC